MAQEFTIKNEVIESKINQLLPSQGGFGAGVDFSASTMIIPIVDVTESAEGSVLREDLQKALSHDQITSFNINNSTNTVIINTPGYYRVVGTANQYRNFTNQLNLFDGTTSKVLLDFGFAIDSTQVNTTLFDIIVFLAAGDSLRGTSTSANNRISGTTRQIADTSGNLVNP